MKIGDKGGARSDDPPAGRRVGSDSFPIRATGHRITPLVRCRTVALAVVSMVAVVAAAVALDLPDPLDGPGHPELGRRDAKKISKAVDRLRSGDLDGARKAAGKADESPARRLIDLQTRMAASSEPPVEDLQRLCSDHPGYAAAWVTLATAAEQGGDEKTALEAARRGAELWPQSPWAHQAEDLEQRWVTDRVEAAQRLMEADQSEDALVEVDAALALDPSNREALLAKARLLADAGRNDDARAILTAMGDDPGAMMLRAEMAEDRGDLSAAMALLTAVPAGYSDRDAALRRVRLAWRRQNLPSYIQEAMESSALTRAGLAMLLIGLAPEANAVGGGQVPILTDIVDLPSQREVLTATRIGLMDVDRVEHLFHPERLVDPEEVRYALGRLNTLLGRNPPDWCTDGETGATDCVELTTPVTGAEVADAVLSTAQGEAP